MAKLRGILKLSGSIDELSYYKTKFGYVVRRKIDKRTFVFKNFWHSGRKYFWWHSDIKQIYFRTILFFSDAFPFNYYSV